MTKNNLETISIIKNADYLASDESEIRLLSEMSRGTICHCTLPFGKTTSPVMHNQVEEIWYLLEGKYEGWRKVKNKKK